MAERPTHHPRFPLTADMSEVMAAARQDRAEAIGRPPLGSLWTMVVQAWLRHIERAIRRLEQEERSSAPRPAPRVRSPRAGRLRVLEFR